MGGLERAWQVFLKKTQSAKILDTNKNIYLLEAQIPGQDYALKIKARLTPQSIWMTTDIASNTNQEYFMQSFALLQAFNLQVKHNAFFSLGTSFIDDEEVETLQVNSKFTFTKLMDEHSDICLAILGQMIRGMGECVHLILEELEINPESPLFYLFQENQGMHFMIDGEHPPEFSEPQRIQLEEDLNQRTSLPFFIPPLKELSFKGQRKLKESGSVITLFESSNEYKYVAAVTDDDNLLLVITGKKKNNEITLQKWHKEGQERYESGNFSLESFESRILEIIRLSLKSRARRYF